MNLHRISSWGLYGLIAVYVIGIAVLVAWVATMGAA